MMYERVDMELEMFHDETAREPVQNRVVVNAYFVMRNQGIEDENMQAVFPSESTSICREDTRGDSFTFYSIRQDSFQVYIDGVNVPITTLETEYEHCLDYRWMAFDITFPVNKDVLVKVSYVMETENVDFAQNINYLLETGAGGKGKIGRGYVILKFPHAVTSENILSDSTHGYQILYNEIFWSFQNLEPTSEDNIQISIVSPNVWLEIQRLRDQIAKLPESPDTWLNLIDIYSGIAFSNKGIFTRDLHYAGLVEDAYEKAIVANPNSAEIFARYAAHKLFGWSPHGEPITQEQARQILPLLSKALALDPNNEDALYVLSQLNVAAPFITFTPPPAIPPTATSLFTVIPSITPTATITQTPSATPIVVTVIHTVVVQPATSTPMPKVSETITPTPTNQQTSSSSTSMIIVLLIGLAAGGGIGFVLSRRVRQ